MPAHSALTGTDLHEPKGVAAADAGDVYVADGAGSGSWEPAFKYASLETVETDTLSVGTIGTTAVTLAFASDGASNGVAADAANNRLTLTEAGTYLITFSISFATAAGADAGLYEFKLMDDGVATGHACATYMSGTTDTSSTNMSALITVGAGSHLTVEVESDNGSDTDDINVYASTLIAMKV
jgi:hypothetical protein